MRFKAALLLALVTGLGLAVPAAAGASGADVRLSVGYADGAIDSLTVAAGSATSTLSTLEASPGVAFAEVDHPVHAADTVPNDPQWAAQAGPIQVGMPKAWDRTTGDPSVIVAVIDSGVDASLPDLAGAVVPGTDFVGHDEDPADENGHGTQVASIIAARGNNGQGIAGYCWDCKVMPVRVLDANGAGSSGDVAQAIQWAVTHGAKVINLSLSGDFPSISVDAAVAQARAAGVLVVAAAGNQTAIGQDLTRPQYPAASTGVISVGAVQTNEQLYSFSYRGSWVDLAAPGCHVAEMAAFKGGGINPNFCGTSSAAPAISGLLGLALSVSPSVTAATLETELLGTAKQTGIQTAVGRVDAAALFTRLGVLFPKLSAPDRVGGGDFVATAIAVSQKVRTTAPAVVIARVEDFADALTAGPLAAKLNAPLLLTPSTGLTQPIGDEIRRLGATTAYVVGGTAAVSPNVDAALPGLGVTTVQRVAGVNRYATSALIAQQVGGTKVFVTNATAFPDAVGVSELAAMTLRPILLVDRFGLPDETRTAFTTLAVTEVAAVGGTAVIDNAVTTAIGALGPVVSRMAGGNRFDTSRIVADATLQSGASSSRIWLATGLDWRDALVAGPAAATHSAVLLLVDGLNPNGSPSTSNFVSANAKRLTELVLVGGGTTVSSATVAKLTQALAT